MKTEVDSKNKWIKCCWWKLKKMPCYHNISTFYCMILFLVERKDLKMSNYFFQQGFELIFNSSGSSSCNKSKKARPFRNETQGLWLPRIELNHPFGFNLYLLEQLRATCSNALTHASSAHCVSCESWSSWVESRSQGRRWIPRWHPVGPPTY